MRSVFQEDEFGCVIACVAFILQIPYQQALQFFPDGESRTKNVPNFYCPEVVKILNLNGLKYSWKKIKNYHKEVFKDRSIVFIDKSIQHPYGHFLCNHNGKWMDPWHNLPKKPIKAGFRDILPGKPTYQIFPKDTFTCVFLSMTSSPDW